MGIFSNIFSTKNLKKSDPELGEITSISSHGITVVWQIMQLFLDQQIEIRIDGNRKGVDKNQKEILLSALNNESHIKSESEDILKEQFKDAVMDFESIEKHYDIIGITVNTRGFELTFQEKDGQFRFFNVDFEDNKQCGFSIEEF